MVYLLVDILFAGLLWDEGRLPPGELTNNVNSSSENGGREAKDH